MVQTKNRTKQGRQKCATLYLTHSHSPPPPTRRARRQPSETSECLTASSSKQFGVIVIKLAEEIARNCQGRGAFFAGSVTEFYYR